MADRDRLKSAKSDADESFLRRWSRRKVEAQSAAAAASDPGVPAEHAPAPRQQPPEPQQGPGAPIDPKDLPDIESLDANSDFTVFMRPGVPEHLRTQALRKLWRSDPVFANLDGLVEYGEDYSIASWPKEVVKTAYKVGRGFLEEIGEDPERPEQALPPEPAEKPADEPVRIAAASAEPLPPEPASPREPGSPQQEPARPAAKRRRSLPAR